MEKNNEQKETVQPVRPGQFSATKLITNWRLISRILMPIKPGKTLLLKPFSFVFDNIDSTSEKDPFLPAYLIESLSDYAYQK